ncbi:MAG: hypothetical protein IPI49_28135 [Myxococcales bacterium]|nr:hypothetical protein [Myxococcales bacterium]HRC55841.1 hypothetical protein [Kofleriaceae bacterium]
MRQLPSLLLASLLGALAACPAPRTTAATRPTPAAFDPANSEPAALALVDTAIAALGGLDKWQQVKELRFEVLYKQSGTLGARYQHRWDRWNGRHAMRTADLKTTGNREEDIKWHDVRYDIFNKDAIFWSSYANQEAERGNYEQAAEQARVRLAEDGYRVALFYKLRDPGVRLALAGSLAPSAGVCEPSCNSVKVTFDAGTGTDTWTVHFNKNSNLPEIFEQETSRGRLGYRIGAWADAGGLKWPSLLSNIGLAGETFEFVNIAVGDPSDASYGRDL